VLKRTAKNNRIELVQWPSGHPDGLTAVDWSTLVPQVSVDRLTGDAGAVGNLVDGCPLALRAASNAGSTSIDTEVIDHYRTENP
jgi:hypothetical protein